MITVNFLLVNKRGTEGLNMSEAPLQSWFDVDIRPDDGAEYSDSSWSRSLPETIRRPGEIVD